MADQTDTPAWLAGIAAAGFFFGGLYKAVFRRRRPATKREEANEVNDIREHVAELKARMDSIERAVQSERAETRESLDKIFSELKTQSGDLRVCRAILDERKTAR